jgi:isopentenyl phosphate kinase
VTDVSITSRHDITVIKLGGSLITDKTRQDTVHDKDLKDLAALLARQTAIQGRLLIIMGGGAIGHFAAKQLRLHQGFPHCDLTRLHRMAEKMYTLKSVLADMLASHGVPALAFQETSYMVARDDGGISLYDLPIRHALRMQIIPILSGGLVFDAIKGVRPLSGDLIPLALDQLVFRIRRVVMLTDVAGVIANDGTIIRHLDAVTRTRIAQLDSPPGRVDITGGMQTKVDVTLALARRGIPSVICNGRGLDDARFESLLTGTPPDCSLVGFRPDNGLSADCPATFHRAG